MDLNAQWSLRNSRARRKLILAVAAGLALGVAAWFALRSMYLGGIPSFALWIGIIQMTCFGEYMPIIAGYFLARSAARTWKDSNRLPELVLTELRPVTIAQLILTRALRNLFVIALIGYLIFLLCFVAYLPEHSSLVFVFFLITIQYLVNLYACTWGALTVRLGLGPMGAIWAYIDHQIVYALFAAPLGAISIVGFIGLQLTLLNPRLPNYAVWPADATAFAICLAIFYFTATWTTRFLYTRAFISNLERIVFPKLEL